MSESRLILDDDMLIYYAKYGLSLNVDDYTADAMKMLEVLVAKDKAKSLSENSKEATRVSKERNC